MLKLVQRADEPNQAQQEAQGLNLFMRTLVGMGRETARQSPEVLEGKTPNVSRIDFLNHPTEHYVMKAARLYESPFADMAPQGPESLFTPTQVDELDSVRADTLRRHNR